MRKANVTDHYPTRPEPATRLGGDYPEDHPRHYPINGNDQSPSSKRFGNQLKLTTEQRNVIVDHIADDVLLDVEVRVSKNHPDSADLAPAPRSSAVLRLDHRVVGNPALVGSVFEEQVAHLDHVEDSVAISMPSVPIATYDNSPARSCSS